MAEKNYIVVDSLSDVENPEPTGRYQVGEGGKKYVWTGASWIDADKWDSYSPEQKQNEAAAAYNRATAAGGTGTTAGASTTDATATGLYDPYDEEKVRAELLKLPPPQRDKYLRDLYEAGAYGGSKRGNGFSPADVNAFAQLLLYSNLEKVNWRVGIDKYKQDFPKQPDLIGSMARRQPKQVTNPDEIKAVFRKTAQTLLGRDVAPEVADQFVRAIQTQQATFQQQLATQSGGTIAQPLDVGLSAQKQIEDRFQEELRVQNAAKFAGSMDEMIKGLAQ